MEFFSWHWNISKTDPRCFTIYVAQGEYALRMLVCT